MAERRSCLEFKPLTSFASATDFPERVPQAERVSKAGTPAESGAKRRTPTRGGHPGSSERWGPVGESPGRLYGFRLGVKSGEALDRRG
jgi:hypothetical protein